MFMRVVAHVALSGEVLGMLRERPVIERAMRALDELLGQQSGKVVLEDLPSVTETPLPEPKSATEPSLKGQTVEIWRDGSRFFIVADEADARRHERGRVRHAHRV